MTGERSSHTNRFGNPIGTDYDPTGDELTPQQACDRINALRRRAEEECYLPENADANNRNAGRVRALSQAVTLLERAGIEPDDGAVYLTDDEVMQDV